MRRPCAKTHNVCFSGERRPRRSYDASVSSSVDAAPTGGRERFNPLLRPTSSFTGVQATEPSESQQILQYFSSIARQNDFDGKLIVAMDRGGELKRITGIEIADLLGYRHRITLFQS